MLENGLHQLPVTDAQGAVLGVVTSSDLIATSLRAPFQLRSEILRAADRDALDAAAARIPAAAISLYEARVPARVVRNQLFELRQHYVLLHLALDEMVGGDLGAHIDDVVGADTELDELPFGHHRGPASRPARRARASSPCVCRRRAAAPV